MLRTSYTLLLVTAALAGACNHENERAMTPANGTTSSVDDARSDTNGSAPDGTSGYSAPPGNNGNNIAGNGAMDPGPGAKDSNSDTH